MKNYDEQIAKAEEQIKQLNNKKKRLISEQKQAERKKLTKRLIEQGVNYSQVSRHKKAFFRGAGYFVYSQYKASASFGVSILSVPCGLFVL